MDIENIQKFHQARSQYFNQIHKIYDALAEINRLKHDAHMFLNASIDNGLTVKRLIEVEAEYEKHMFSSNVVEKFLDDIDMMFLKDVPFELKKNLEVVNVCINVNDDDYDSKTTVIGPVKVTFVDYDGKDVNHTFTLVIPVKDTCSCDIKNWNMTDDGIYAIYASHHINDRRLMICRVFDSKKISRSVTLLLSGSYDKEMIDKSSSEYDEEYFQSQRSYTYSEHSSLTCDLSYMEYDKSFYRYENYDDIRLIAEIFRSNYKAPQKINSIIDDTNEYAHLDI